MSDGTMFASFAATLKLLSGGVDGLYESKAA